MHHVALIISIVLLLCIHLDADNLPLCRRGLKLNPITSLYYISPACFACLLLPFFLFELPKVRQSPLGSSKFTIELLILAAPDCRVHFDAECLSNVDPLLSDSQ